MIEVVGLPAFNDNYIWLLRESGKAVVVDPGDAAPVLRHLAITGDTLTAILLTHHHGDHIGGVEELVLRCAVPPVVYGPATEDIPSITHPLGGGEHICPAGLNTEFQVLAVPGHTRGHLAYYGPAIGEGALFCGDTLFGAGCGRLFEGTPAQMHASLTAIAVLPTPTLVYCAHEYTQANLRFALTIEPNNQDIQARIADVTACRDQNLPTVPGSLKLELATNPFLRTSHATVIEKAKELLGHPPGSDTEVFAAIRQARNDFR